MFMFLHRPTECVSFRMGNKSELEQCEKCKRTVFNYCLVKTPYYPQNWDTGKPSLWTLIICSDYDSQLTAQSWMLSKFTIMIRQYGHKALDTHFRSGLQKVLGSQYVSHLQTPGILWRDVRSWMVLRQRSEDVNVACGLKAWEFTNITIQCNTSIELI